MISRNLKVITAAFDRKLCLNSVLLVNNHTSAWAEQSIIHAAVPMAARKLDYFFAKIIGSGPISWQVPGQVLTNFAVSVNDPAIICYNHLWRFHCLPSTEVHQAAYREIPIMSPPKNNKSPNLKRKYPSDKPSQIQLFRERLSEKSAKCTQQS